MLTRTALSKLVLVLGLTSLAACGVAAQQSTSQTTPAPSYHDPVNPAGTLNAPVSTNHGAFTH